MYPNNAAKIYEELLEKQMIEESIQQQADYLAKMDPGEAADILSELHVLCKGFYGTIFVDVVFLWGKHCEVAGGCVAVLAVLPACRIMLLKQRFHPL